MKLSINTRIKQKMQQVEDSKKMWAEIRQESKEEVKQEPKPTQTQPTSTTTTPAQPIL